MPEGNQPKNQRTEVYQREGRRWPILVGLVVAALLVSSAVALGGRWAYRELTEDEPPKPAPTATTDNQPAEQAAPATEQGQPAVGGTNTGPAATPSTGGLPVTGDTSDDF